MMLQWVMTTFDAVRAHWPKPPKSSRSTGRSKRTKGSSIFAPSSPLPHPAISSSPKPPSSPTRVESPTVRIKAEPDIIEASDEVNGQDEDVYFSDDEEENPFHLFAMTQGSDTMDIKAEVNPHIISKDNGYQSDNEEENIGAMHHAEEAKRRADEGRNFRATQAAKGDESDEYNDDELDALFNRTIVSGNGSLPTTPRKRWQNGSATPGTPTTGATLTGGLSARRDQRAQRMREQAGWGNLRSVP